MKYDIKCENVWTNNASAKHYVALYVARLSLTFYIFKQIGCHSSRARKFGVSRMMRCHVVLLKRGFLSK